VRKLVLLPDCERSVGHSQKIGQIWRNERVRIRPHQIWANVSDLYVSWSKVAIGFIIHKNDKKLNQLLFDAYSMSVSMETTQNIEQCKISTIERARTKKIFLK